MKRKTDENIENEEMEIQAKYTIHWFLKREELSTGYKQLMLNKHGTDVLCLADWEKTLAELKGQKVK